MKHLVHGALLISATYLLDAQSIDPQLRFEVASVKPNQQADPRNERSTVDPGRLEYLSVPLATLIIKAYNLRSYQLVCPAWMTSARYEVVAKVPVGTSAEQQTIMMQNLLVERFRLAVHREIREMPVHALVIAKGGPKLKLFVPHPQPGDSDKTETPLSKEPKAATDSDGFPLPPPNGGTLWVAGLGGKMHEHITLEVLAKKLAALTGRPVSDQTGIEGIYEIAIRWGDPTGLVDGSGSSTVDHQDSATGLKASLESKLGLTLVRKIGSVEVLVVDYAERTPVTN